MGAAPTAVDAVLLGALRAHLIADPIPAASIEHGYPRLIEWAARRVPYRGPQSGDLPKTRTFIQWVLDEMSGEYASYARKNRDAVRDGCRVIHLGMGGEKYTVLARRETEASRIKTSKMIRNIALRGWMPIRFWGLSVSVTFLEPVCGPSKPLRAYVGNMCMVVVLSVFLDESIAHAR